MRSLLLILALSAASAVPVPAQDAPRAESEVPDDPLELMRHSHRHLIKGCESDLERNTRAVVFYRKKSEEATVADQKVQYNKLAAAFESLAEINKQVLQAFRDGGIEPAREALAKLPEVEATIQAISGKPVDREWLTFAEVESLITRVGAVYNTEAPRVLPFHRRHWDPQAIQARQRELEAKPVKP